MKFYGGIMARVVPIGIQNFEKLVSNDSFYIDKTEFIKEWWESRDEVCQKVRNT